MGMVKHNRQKEETHSCIARPPFCSDPALPKVNFERVDSEQNGGLPLYKTTHTRTHMAPTHECLGGMGRLIPETIPQPPTLRLHKQT